ncbi:MAG: nucleotide exchange factor GrpE [Crocinitomix sp.]|nr:nucleotide exchange factor GrpE [Crocinitomix sp.]
MSEKEHEEMSTKGKNKEDKKKVNEEAEMENSVDQVEVEDKVVETEEVKPPSLEDQLVELNNKYIRLYSDFDNFRKRTIKEKADIISTANGALMLDLIGTLDDFERAIANNEKMEDAAGLREGFKLIYNKFSATLKNKGLEAMECKGDVFNPDMHEAITNIPVQDPADKGKIVDVIERGYNLRGKSLRYAKVIVGQ